MSVDGGFETPYPPPMIALMASLLCPAPWVCEPVPFTVRGRTETLRAGYYPESGTFRGNVLYFEGLGDSMLNHRPLFNRLSQAGYRVIAFDYQGQGGSTGRMSRTRIAGIVEIGREVWKKFARDIGSFPRRSVIGWSTGGLAAYLSASKRSADNVVLIAPGIVPNTLVGEKLSSWPPNQITPESLTTAAPYAKDAEDPHLDPIRPTSPVKAVGFALDLLSTAKSMRKQKIPPTVAGFVLLSGQDDTYVDAEKTREVLAANAPHFSVVQYEGALHEIDNEREAIQKKAIEDIVTFLNAHSP